MDFKPKMKVAVIIFHKNVWSYPEKWIHKCVTSILMQTYSEFDVFEIDYGGEDNSIYPGSNFESKKLNNHAEAHNYLLDKVFALDYDYAFNVNVDDYYALNRFEIQLKYAEQGHDVISSNFFNIDEDNNVIQAMNMHRLNMHMEAIKGHNVIAHPVLCYSRKFWTTCTKLKGEEIPCDDFKLWKRSFGKYSFIIIPNFLLFYRIHQQKASAKNNSALWEK